MDVAGRIVNRRFRFDRWRTPPHWGIVFEPRPRWTTYDAPVVNGFATLRDGRTVASRSQVVRVPVLVA